MIFQLLIQLKRDLSQQFFKGIKILTQLSCLEFGKISQEAWKKLENEAGNEGKPEDGPLRYKHFDSCFQWECGYS